MPEIKIKGYMSSGLKDASVAIKASRGFLGGVLCESNGANDPTITLHDNATAGSGTALFYFKQDVSRAFADGGDGLYYHFVPMPDVPFMNGCYLTLSGTGAKAIVYYR